MISRLRRLPLRSRLALLTAAAVAIAVALVALASWFITRDQLMDQLDKSLRQAQVPKTLDMVGRYGCRDAKPPGFKVYGVNAERTTAQLVGADGTACWAAGEHTIPVTAADRQVAQAGDQPDASGALHTVTSDGTEWRVFTRPFPGASVGGRPAAISIAKPLSEVSDPLNTLAIVLGIVAAGGVIGAAGAGVALARAGLRPVEELTGTVEHVAETEDLSVRIPVDGDDEIARLSRSFNAMTEALASSRARQQQLIADAGHELRTPLTSLRTNIELLVRSEESGRELPPEDRRRLLASVTAQMTELGALIGDLQELSRPDAVPGSGPVAVVALHDAAERAVRRARLRGTGLDIAVELKPWFVRAEPSGLERALVNLLDNAVKFSPPGGRVEVRLAEGELTVRDHGPGIPDEDLPYVFERFWRSSSARSLPGSGLGLSIVARAVHQAGGTVFLRPAPGGGTEAVARFPGAAQAPPALPG